MQELKVPPPMGYNAEEPKSLPQRIREALGRTDTKVEDLRPSTQMLLAMSRLNKPIYEGTANPRDVAKRRAKNKRARATRRAQR